MGLPLEALKLSWGGLGVRTPPTPSCLGWLGRQTGPRRLWHAHGGCFCVCKPGSLGNLPACSEGSSGSR